MRTDRREQLYDDLVRQVTSAQPVSDRAAMEASLNLALSYDVHQSYLWRPLSCYGLARSSFNVLALLRHANPEGLQLSEIGELLITSRANITGLVDHLEQKGYVKRVIDSHDRRARVARLTKKGEALIDRILPDHLQRSAAFFSNLSTHEVQQLTELLKKVRRGAAAMNAGEDAAVLEPAFSNGD